MRRYDRFLEIARHVYTSPAGGKHNGKRVDVIFGSLGVSAGPASDGADRSGKKPPPAPSGIELCTHLC